MVSIDNLDQRWLIIVEDHFLLSIKLVIKSGIESEVRDLNQLIAMFTLYLDITLVFYLVDGL